MGIERFMITLDNPAAVYFPGKQVKGQLHIFITEKPKLLKGLVLKFKGCGRVSFTRSDVNNDSRTFWSNEEYLRTLHPLLTSNEDRGRLVKLDLGYHEYPFSFTLPRDGLPPSYEGRYGNIQYTITGMSSEQRGKMKRRCKVGFTMNTIVDLHLLPVAMLPVREEKEFKSSCCFVCCKAGPVVIKAWIDRAGYVQGETIYFSGVAENSGGRPAKGSKVQLVEVAEFHAMGETERDLRVVSEMKHGEFMELDFWDQKPITLPSITSFNFHFCKLINISYQIDYEINLGSSSTSVTLPLLIGNIPLCLDRI